MRLLSFSFFLSSIFYITTRFPSITVLFFHASFEKEPNVKVVIIRYYSEMYLKRQRQDGQGQRTVKCGVLYTLSCALELSSKLSVKYSGFAGISAIALVLFDFGPISDRHSR